MAPTPKPNMEIAWANSGSISEPNDTKKNTGWIVEKPPLEFMNWIQNRIDQFAQHVNERGIIEYDSATEYPDLAWVRSTVDGLIYVSNTTPNQGNEPSVSAEWDLLEDYLKQSFDLAYMALLSGATAGRVVQVAAGGEQVEDSGVDTTDIRIFTDDEFLAIQNANAPTALNPVATVNDIVATAVDQLTVIQGSVDAQADTTPGYIDSTAIAESGVGLNGNIFYSINGGAGATSTNWSSILPLVRPVGTQRTIIRLKSFFVSTLFDADEDFAEGTISIDWALGRVNGWMMISSGASYTRHSCFRFTGAIGAGNNDFVGVLQNGNFASIGDTPELRIDGTTGDIVRLPMAGRFRNVGFEILHQQ